MKDVTKAVAAHNLAQQAEERKKQRGGGGGGKGGGVAGGDSGIVSTYRVLIAVHSI